MYGTYSLITLWYVHIALIYPFQAIILKQSIIINISINCLFHWVYFSAWLTFGFPWATYCQIVESHHVAAFYLLYVAISMLLPLLNWCHSEAHRMMLDAAGKRNLQLEFYFMFLICLFNTLFAVGGATLCSCIYE